MCKQNRAAIYCRLSKDDEQIGDSVSIETQRMLLTSYCASQNFEIVDIYIDDGYSGLNFNRPSFTRLIHDLENGKFDIVITKDLSRLGRDYIQTGYYIDVYFSTKHIRYIAVNDGIDTLSGSNDIAPFKNILNDMYARDLSRKVKSAKQQRAKSGMYISSQTPYGYRVDPYNKNRLVIDPEPAKIVQYIFELVYAGKSYSEISRILECKQILSPSAYKAMNGDTRFIKFTAQDQMYKWPYQTIKAIICNQIYVGDMVNHKVEIVNYKTKERVRIPHEDQIIVPHTHEAIIDRRLFETVNLLFAKRRGSNHTYENLFKGLIRCAECGDELQLIAKRTGDTTVPMFRCIRHFANNTVCTHHHFIYYEDLLEKVRDQIVLRLESWQEPGIYAELCERVITYIHHRAQEMQKERLQKEIQMMNKKIKDLYRTRSADMREELERLYRRQRELLQKLTGPATDFAASPSEYDAVRGVLEVCFQQIPIDQNTIKLFIEKIEIGHLIKGPSGEATQMVRINYRFRQILQDINTGI